MNRSNIKTTTFCTLAAAAFLVGCADMSERQKGTATGAAIAQPKKEVTIAHQDMLVPLRIVQESGELERTTGYKINWRMFGGGGDVIKAMASGDVQIGEAGSSPITAAASQGQDVRLFWILDDIGDAEALIVRNGSGINGVKDLKGKKVATPFVSTSHYQLMVAMKLDGLSAKDVNVMNLRPPEIAAAWERLTAQTPHVILLDIVLPDGDGILFCKEIKGHERLQDIPVLFITGVSDTEDKVQAYVAGGSDYIVKPFTADALQTKLEAIYTKK